MKICGVMVFVFLVVGILAFSNGAPQGGTAGESGSGQMGSSTNFRFGMGASAGASASGKSGGSGSSGSSDSSSLVKRDLVNHAPIAHHLRSFFGPGWGQGLPPGPPPMFGGGFGQGFGPGFGQGFNFTGFGQGFNFTGFGPNSNFTAFFPRNQNQNQTS